MVIEKCTDFSGAFFWFGGGGGWGEGDMWEDLSSEEYVMGEEKFNEKGAGSSSISRKNNEIINKKKFFPLKVRSSVKT